MNQEPYRKAPMQNMQWKSEPRFAGYVPDHVEICDIHGEFVLSLKNPKTGDRIYIRHSDLCPSCLRQREANRLFISADVPMRFIDCSFENYETETAEQKAVLNRCMKYASEFEKMRDSCTNLLLCGDIGTGKNHLATAILRRATELGYSALRIKAQRYLDAYWGKNFDAREGWLKKLSAIDLLWIDEIGRSSSSKSSQNVFFEIIDSRYESKCPTIVTTNYNREQLISEDMLGEAAYDRLTQGKSIRLTLKWESYRTKAS